MRRKVEFQAPVAEQVEMPGVVEPVVVDETPVVEAKENPTHGYTGGTCPECRLAQFYIPGGVRCPKEHFYLDGDKRLFNALSFEAMISTAAKDKAAAAIPRKKINGVGSLKPEAPKVEPLVKEQELVKQADPNYPMTRVPPAVVAAVIEELSPKVPVSPPRPAAPCVKPLQVSAPTGDRSPVEAKPVVDLREKAASSIDELVLGEGYERIVTRVFAVDPWATYEPLERSLRLAGDAHMADYATLVDALDLCQDNSREAHRLYVSAKVSVARYESDATVLLTYMRKQATAALDAEKLAGQRSKQITEADVESKIAALFPDEWRTLEDRRAKAKAMVSHLERLSELWKERARDIRVMVEASRR